MDHASRDFAFFFSLNPGKNLGYLLFGSPRAGATGQRQATAAWRRPVQRTPRLTIAAGPPNVTHSRRPSTCPEQTRARVSNAYAGAGKQCTRRVDDGGGGGVSACSQHETLQRSPPHARAAGSGAGRCRRLVRAGESGVLARSVLGIQGTRLRFNFSSSGLATCEPGGLRRRPAIRTRRLTPEDHATPPRRTARAHTALPRRGRLVWRSARFDQKCTTR